MKKRTITIGRVPDADAIATFRGRPGVWLTFAASAFLILYADRLRSLELKPNWVIALAIIAEQPGITQSGFARALRINRASAMVLATLLETAGLVNREALDGRKRTALTLSTLGDERFMEACAIEEELGSTVFEWQNADEQVTFLRVMKRVTTHVGQVDR